MARIVFNPAIQSLSGDIAGFVYRQQGDGSDRRKTACHKDGSRWVVRGRGHPYGFLRRVDWVFLAGRLPARLRGEPEVERPLASKRSPAVCTGCEPSFLSRSFASWVSPMSRSPST